MQLSIRNRTAAPSYHAAWVLVVTLLGAIAIFAPLTVLSPAASAQDDSADEVVIFVLDLSGSMNERFDADQTKLDVAKAAFVEAFANVSPDALVGLRTYGDQIEPTIPEERSVSCSVDSRLVTPVAPLERNELISQVQSFNALGDTPMALALERAAADIPTGATGTIVLFSDGRDECFDADLDGDAASGPSFGEEPCAVARNITAGDSRVDRVVTVGFRADQAAESELRCIAEATGGAYTAIETPEDARDVLPELLVQLSAPREAKRLIGREIEGGDMVTTAPDLQRLDEVNADKVLYTDSIDMNEALFYRIAEYGPDGGTVTATVFGLPAEPDITFDMWAFVPSLNRRFFEDNGDQDAGLPTRPSASIRCTDCRFTDGPYEVIWIISLTSDNPEATGTYDLEFVTEGPAFGGSSTSCSAPQECFYPAEIAERRALLDALEAQLTDGTDSLASADLIAERDRLLEASDEAQLSMTNASTQADRLEGFLPTAPAKTNSYRLPLLMVLGGLILGFAPLHKLRRSASADDSVDEADTIDEVPVGASEDTVGAEAAPSPGLPASALDVGPAPAVSPLRKGSGRDWDDELEAAKAALAEQRPTQAEAPRAPATSAIPVDLASSDAALEAAAAAIDPESAGGFTPEQHAAAKAAAEQIAAQTAAAAQQPAAAEPAATTPSNPGGFTPEQHAAAKAAAEQIAAQQTAAAQQSSESEPAVAQAAEATMPPGWYPDPSKAARFRWWSGAKWTEHTTDGQQS